MTTANSAESITCPATDRNYEAQAIWDVLIAASVERVAVEMACRSAAHPKDYRQLAFGFLRICSACGLTPKGGIRGPFDTPPRKPNSVPTYPVLWAHNAKKERTLAFEADREGIPRRGTTPEEQAVIDLKVSEIWNTASHCHFNCDFRFNSQSTAMQFTFRRTIGGRAWLSERSNRQFVVSATLMRRNFS